MIERALATAAEWGRRARPNPEAEAEAEAEAASAPRTGVLSPFQPFKELLLVGGTAFVQIGATAMAAQNQPEHGSLGIGAALLLALAVLVLPLRHRFPVLTLMLIFATTLAYWSLDNAGGPVFLALIISLVHVVLIGRRWVAIASLVVGFVLFPWLGYLLGYTDRPPLVALVGLAAWMVALVAVAEVVRIRRDRIAEAARSAAEAMRRQAADERVRIARDLHDSVAHNMSLISIQAGVALHLLEEAGRRSARDVRDGAPDPQATPDQVRRSLAVIKEASREALMELRSVLGVLRHVDEVDATDEAHRKVGGPGDEASDTGATGSDTPAAGPLAPVPGLVRLDSLVERSRSIGLDVRVELPAGGQALEMLPRPVDIAAYRIIQESLTNVSRHSDSATALVRIGKRNGMLTVSILDEGSDQVAPRDLPGGGNGIVGMKERAAAVGGRLQAGPRPGQGFAVRAELPLDEQPAPGVGTSGDVR